MNFLKEYHRLGLFFDYLSIKDARNLCLVLGSCRQSKLLSSELNKHIMNRPYFVDLAIKQNYWTTDDILTFFLPFQECSEKLVQHIDVEADKKFFLAILQVDFMREQEDDLPALRYFVMEPEDMTQIAMRILNDPFLEAKWSLLSKIYENETIEQCIIDIAIREKQYDFIEQKVGWLSIAEMIDILIKTDDKRVINRINEHIQENNLLHDIIYLELPYETHQIIVNKLENVELNNPHHHRINWDYQEYRVLYSKFLNNEQFDEIFMRRNLKPYMIKILIDDSRFDVERAILIQADEMKQQVSDEDIEIMSILCQACKEKRAKQTPDKIR